MWKKTHSKPTAKKSGDTSKWTNRITEIYSSHQRIFRKARACMDIRASINTCEFCVQIVVRVYFSVFVQLSFLDKLWRSRKSSKVCRTSPILIRARARAFTRYKHQLSQRPQNKCDVIKVMHFRSLSFSLPSLLWSALIPWLRCDFFGGDAPNASHILLLLDACW